MSKPAELRFLLYFSFLMRAVSRPSRRSSEDRTSVRKIAQADLPTRYGRFTIFGFQGPGKNEEAVALVIEAVKGKARAQLRFQLRAKPRVPSAG